MKSTLIIGGTDIGNPEDTPRRTLEACRSANLLIFEGDSHARSVLKAAGVHRNYAKYSEHRENDALIRLEEALRNGETVLYCSDQGMPSIADPGRELVRKAQELKADIKGLSIQDNSEVKNIIKL